VSSDGPTNGGASVAGTAPATGGDFSTGAGAVTPLSAAAKPALGRGFRLQWEPAQNAHVLLYPEGMVKLNGSAGEILKRCDGALTVVEIVSDLESAFATTGLEKDVRAFVTVALERQWLEIRE
jgi:pyrroloquinoline quinone biosynthesis protein D